MKFLVLFIVFTLLFMSSTSALLYQLSDFAKNLSIKSYYLMDDASTHLTDNYKGNYNSTSILTMQWGNQSSLFGSSIYFTGDTEHFFRLNESATSTIINNNFSIIIFFKWRAGDGDPNSHRIYQESPTANDFQIQPDGPIYYTPSGGTSVLANSSIGNASNVWQMLTFVCHNGTMWEVYLNDTLILRNNTLACNIPSTPLKFGTDSVGNRNFAGNFENLIVLNQSINRTTVALIWTRKGIWDASNALYNYTVNYTRYAYTNAFEKFYLNLSYNSSAYSSVEAALYYDGALRDTVYPQGSGNTVGFIDSFYLPAVSSTTDKFLYWNIHFLNSSGEEEFDTPEVTQTISNISVDNCQVGSIKMMNITLQDEETKSYFNSSFKAFNASIEVDISVYAPGNSSPFINYTGRFNYTNNVSICINRNLTSRYYTYSQIKYYADSYESEYYYIQNASVTNASLPINITLFDLLSVDSTTFLVTYKDSSYLGIENALLVLKRKYVSDGVYRTVEIAATDENGQGILHLDTNGVDYAIEVYKDGTLLSSFDKIVAYCEDSVIGNCKINLYASASVTEADNFYTSRNIGYSVSFNQSNKVATLSYAILDGSSSTVSINITKLDTYMNATLCSSDITGSSGTLTCDVNTTYGNTTFLVEIYKDNQLIASEIYSIIEKATDIFGDNTIVLILAQFLTLAFMMLPSFIGVMIALILGLIISVGLFLLSGSIFGSAASIAWMIIAIIILIIKFHNRGTS